jgi:hypothetical protein
VYPACATVPVARSCLGPRSDAEGSTGLNPGA